MKLQPTTFLPITFTALYYLTIILPIITTLHIQTLPPLLSLYNSNQQLNKIIQQLSQQYPNITKLKQCQQDNNIKYLHIGNKRQSDGIIICNIHARQLISAQICINWVKKYVQNMNNMMGLQKDKDNKNYDGFAINLFYNANLNRQDVTANGQCVRKSVSGIDLNRNFPTQFNFYNAPTDSQIYGGTTSIIDPFTSCLSLNIQQNKPIFFIDVHSGQNGGLYYQQGYNSRQDRNILQILNKQIFNDDCRITTLARDGQAINGHIFADLKVRYNMKYSLLLEVYGNDNTDDCLLMFNPGTKEEFQNAVKKWGNGIDVILREIWKRERL